DPKHAGPLGENRWPCPLVRWEPHNRVASILEPLSRLAIARSNVSVVVNRAVYEDRRLITFVEEVRSRVQRLQPPLRAPRQLVTVLVQEPDPLALEFGVAQVEQPFEVLLARKGPRRHRYVRVGEGKQKRGEELPVEQLVVGLVRVAHQAVVTSRLAGLASAG